MKRDETTQFKLDFLPMQPAMQRMAEHLLRKRKPTVEIDERTMALAEEQSREDEERIRLALQMVDRLPERQAQAVRLKHFDDADTDRIAAEMHINAGNVYTLLSRAYSSLKQMILEYENR